ncbi:MAG TPA: transketolase C-terminal domain-containing protein, partial [Labilithrix sp.]
MQSYEQILEQKCKEDDRIVVMTAENRAAIRGLPPKIGDRFIDVGICEQTMIGAAAGLALRGRIPICHALATFLVLRAFEFIRTDVGIANLPVKLVGAVPGFLSEANGPTHQALEDVSILRGIPRMQVFAPADEAELVAMVPKIAASGSPAYIRYCAHAPAVEHRGEFEIGKAEVLSEGSDVTLLTYGFLLREALKAKAILQSKRVGVRLVNMRTLKPVDERIIVRAAHETKLMVTVEDHFLTGGLFSIVAETLAKTHTSCRVLPLALEERWFKPGLLADVLAYEG